MLEKAPDKLHPVQVAMAAMLAIAILACAPARADAAGPAEDHEQARQAMKTGKILPLQTLLTLLERDYPGQIMAIELERSGDSWQYEIKLLRPGGALVKLKVDAREGKVLDIKEKNGKNRHSGETR